jgi:ferredoxin--NADP+ reductase
MGQAVDHPSSDPVARRLTYNATIAERVDLTETLAIFRIRPDKPRRRVWFTSGQYCVLGLNNDETPQLGSVQRPVSIASAPEAANPVEFYIRLISRPTSQNPFTRLLWNLKAGDRIHMRPRAAGVFTIDKTVGPSDQRLRVMVAAGTGIAPFISMLRSEVCRNPAADLRCWVLLHGVSYAHDLGYRAELLHLSAANGLNYWGTISRGSEPQWSGDLGRVESFFDPDRLPDLEMRLGLPARGLTPERAVVFVCGLKGTIAATLVRLIDRGFVPHAAALRRALGVPAAIASSVYFEDYDPDEPLIDLSNREMVEPLRARVQAALAVPPAGLQSSR